jgi:hypothetical protein
MCAAKVMAAGAIGKKASLLPLGLYGFESSSQLLFRSALYLQKLIAIAEHS